MHEFESVLTIKDKKGILIAIVWNDMKNRSCKIFGVNEYGLEDIKTLMEKNLNNLDPSIPPINPVSCFIASPDTSPLDVPDTSK